jgi:DNA repair exonuclease SbcCD ATPase subunit
MILKSVSTYLSRMRGEPSIVERVEKTFVINGRPYTSYSGSALDLLALGIRIALTKVFVPGADMLVLDEPFAACDATRTMECLSFAAAAGFGQTIIITHEAQTEGVFDNLVEV